jgi:hypothetical protein
MESSSDTRHPDDLRPDLVELAAQEAHCLEVASTSGAAGDEPHHEHPPERRG